MRKFYLEVEIVLRNEALGQRTFIILKALIEQEQITQTTLESQKAEMKKWNMQDTQIGVFVDRLEWASIVCTHA